MKIYVVMEQVRFLNSLKRRKPWW